jgi:hypothetical protein
MAMDGFSPYYQDCIYDRLKSHLRPDHGRLYIVGLQPIPHSASGDANIICKTTKMRDACILLANHRCYREYPLEWTIRNLKRSGFRVVDHSTFPILYTHQTIVRQLNVARSKLPLFSSRGLAEKMRKEIDELEHESSRATAKSPNNRIKLGYDYIVVAEIDKVT